MKWIISLRICLLSILVLPEALASGTDNEADDPRELEEVGLRKFLAQLEKSSTKDIVFLLDSSGFVDSSGFGQMKLLTGAIVRQFLRVAEDQDRVAVVSFSTETITDVNYINDERGENMCSLLKEIEDVVYQGEYRFTYLAMEKARDVLREARPESEKIVVLLTNGLGMRGTKSFMLADELKSEEVVIFVIGFEDVSEKIKEMATSADHSLLIGDFDNVDNIINLLHRDVGTDMCGSACDKNAQCHCEAPTGNFKCICNAGYFKNPNNSFECLKCPKGSFKSDSDDLHCKRCPPHATTLEEGGTSSDNCLCEPRFEKSAGGFCSVCPKGTYKDETSNRRCVKCPPNSFTIGEGSRSIDSCICRNGNKKIGKLCASSFTTLPPLYTTTPEWIDSDDYDDNIKEVTSSEDKVFTAPPTVTTKPLPFLPEQLSPRKDSECTKTDYNVSDEVDSSLPLLIKLMKALPRKKRLPKIMELLNNVYDSIEK